MPIRPRERWLVLGLLWLSFALHLAVLRQLEANSPFFYQLPPAVDQVVYLENGLAFTKGQWPGDRPFFLSPYYSFYLGFNFDWFGFNLILPRLWQAAQGVLVCALTYQLGRQLFTPRIALLALAALATYGPFIFYNLSLTTAAHSALWITLAVYVTWRYRQTRKLWLLWLGGGLVGLAALGQPNMILVLGGLGLWLLGTPGRQWQTWSALGVLVIAATLTLLPASGHNYHQTGQLGFVTTSGDYNLYIGNNPAARGVYQAVPDELQRQVAAGETTYNREVLNYISRQPLDWLRLQGMKLVLYLVGSDMELGSNTNYHFWGVLHSTWLRLLPLRFEVLALLWLVGLRLIWSERAALLYAVTGVYTLGTVLFFVQTRFRVPFTPLMILLAAALTYKLYHQVRGGNRGAWLLVIGLLIALAAILLRYAYLLSGGLEIVS